MSHELGHALGLHHAKECAPASCSGGFSDTVTQYTYSNDSYCLLVPNQGRHLWEYDIAAVRNGGVIANFGCNGPSSTTVSAYGRHTGLQVRHRVAQLSFGVPLSWATETDHNDTSTATPAVSQGTRSTTTPWCITPPCDLYVVAFAGTDASNQIYTRTTNGTTWISSEDRTTGGWTRHAPAIAFGNGRWVLVHVSADDRRILYQQTSTDGFTWTSPVAITYIDPGSGATVNADTQSSPALAYDPSEARFILMWSDRFDDRMNALTNSGPWSASTWSNLYTAPACSPYPCNSQASLGIGLACNGSDQCAWTSNNDDASWDLFTNGGSITSGQFAPTFSFTGVGYRAWWAPGVAYGGGYFALGYYSAVYDDSSKTARSRVKTSYDPSVAFGNASDIATGVRSGITMAYSPYYNEFAAYFLKP